MKGADVPLKLKVHGEKSITIEKFDISMFSRLYFGSRLLKTLQCPYRGQDYPTRLSDRICSYDPAYAVRFDPFWHLRKEKKLLFISAPQVFVHSHVVQTDWIRLRVSEGYVQNAKKTEYTTVAEAILSISEFHPSHQKRPWIRYTKRVAVQCTSKSFNSSVMMHESYRFFCSAMSLKGSFEDKIT